MKSKVLIVLLGFILTGCGGCPADTTDDSSDNPGEGSESESLLNNQWDQTRGQMSVSLHDKPSAGGNIEKVEIPVSFVEISPANDQWQTISKGSQIFDLLTLKDGVEAVLAQSSLAVGTYEQIRLHLADNPRVLVDGTWQPLRIPSGFQTGLKLNGPFEIRAGQITKLILDMDPDKNIHYVPGQNQWYLQPSLEMEAIYIGIETPEGEFQPTAVIEPVTATGGGTIELGDGASLVIPAGALQSDTQISLEKAVGGYPAYVLKPDGLTFTQPVTLILPYEELPIPEGKGSQDIILFLDEEEVPITIDTIHQTVTTKITHFTVPHLSVKGNVYLTIDDGPLPNSFSGEIEEFLDDAIFGINREPERPRDERILSDLLEKLDEKDVTATFFQVGRLIEFSPDLVTQLLLDGHKIGNHSYYHDIANFAGQSDSEIRTELTKTNNLIQNAAVSAIRHLVNNNQWEAASAEIRRYLIKLYVHGGPSLFRAPGGRVASPCSGGVKWCSLRNFFERGEGEFSDPGWLDTNVELAAFSLNMAIFHWDVDSTDWNFDKQKKTGTELLNYFKTLEIKTDNVILLHERRTTVEAITEIIDYLKQNGYSPAIFDPSDPSLGLPNNISLSTAQAILDRQEPLPEGILIIDDLSEGFDLHSDTPEHEGYWLSAKIGYPAANPHMFYTWNNGPDASGNTTTAVVQNWADWTPNVSENGFYKVEAFIPKNHAYTKKALYQIFHRDNPDDGLRETTEACRIDQSLYFDQWIDLGSYAFNGGTGEFIKLDDLTDETDTTKQIGFDAVRFTKTSEIEKRKGANCL
ncbi:MAG: DUF4382 domain-containing protein [Deltaproteobacteria bacterium]|nr:DUF4382 domain-containing protein [Deltaproteobacteria bacterium]